MKKIYLGLGLIASAISGYSQNGLDSIIVEKYYVSNTADAVGTYSLTPGSVTYRVYADLKAGYKFQAMYGELTPGVSTPLHTLLINTSTTFFNNGDRGKTDANGITSTYCKTNTVALDSWFSVGAAAGGQIGVLKSEDDGAANLIFPHTPAGLLTNTTTSTGLSLAAQDGMIAGAPEPVQFVGLTTEADVFGDIDKYGNSFSTSNGAISSLNGSVGPTATNRVLIGQFTTDGIFHFELNLQIGSVGGGVEKWVASSPQGGEFTMPSLTYTSSSMVANVAPTVSITAPVTAATYTTGATVTVVANAADSDGTIDSVEFFVDGVKIGKDLSSPYSNNFIAAVGTHTLTAIATDNGGAKTTSAAKTIIVSNTTVGINETNISDVVLVYPNPTTDFLSININSSKLIGGSYSIYDESGTLITNKKLSGNNLERIDMSSYKSGLYILELLLDGTATTTRIIKN